MATFPVSAFGSPESAAPAVVIGGELNALGVCRSLARGGMSVWVVDRKRWNPALRSRHAIPVVTDALHGPGFIAFLRELQRRIGQPAFLAVTDELAMLTISEHRHELEGLYHFCLPPHDLVLMLHDKARFHENAIAHGWPVPNSVVVRSPADLAKMALLRLPIILKPADKRHFHAGSASRLITADTHLEALAAGEKLLAQAGTIVVQEIIEGPDDNIHFCLFYRGRNGEMLGLFTGRKLAATPPGTGSTTYCIAAPNEELERTTRAFLDQVNYSGFGSVEYKLDRRTGRFLIIEPTVGRTDWQEEAATVAGVNIPLIACRHELGLQPLPIGPVDDGLVWQASWIERIRTGSKPIPPRSTIVDGYWRFDDPMPALVHYGFRAAGWMASRLRRRFFRPHRKPATVTVRHDPRQATGT